MKAHSKRRRAGFTLTEMLVVVGIIAILLGIGVPSILHYQRELKLTELDDNARAVFIAAQNHLTALRSASVGELKVSAATGRPAKKSVEASTLAGTELLYVSKDVDDAKPGWLVLPGSIESDLAEGSYLVEFEPKSGTVYGVFFLEKGGKVLDESAYQKLCAYADGGNSCRVRAGRKAFSRSSGGFYVGYYGADGALDVDRPASQTLPRPKLTLINAEELVLKIDTESWPTGIDADKVYASVSVSDGAHTKTLIEGRIQEAGGSVVLDTLDTEKYSRPETTNTWNKVGGSFAQWMDDKSGGYTITPGADITVTVSIFYKPDVGEGVVALPQSASRKTNSLFAARSETGETVSVAYGRHLQNLATTSNLDSAITAAVQMKKIDFAKTGDGLLSWADIYSDRKFTPISNANLKSYNGQSQLIENMDATATPYAGLFSNITDMTLENIVLVDAKVNGMGSAGALAGVAQNTKVENCQVYLNALANGTTCIKSNGTAAGLIGLANGNVSIDSSFASTVIEGGTVGGLVGRGRGVTVQNSYAASHLLGNQVGGLVGGLESNDAAVTIQNCYAAGSIARATSEAAGLLVPHPGTTAATNRITIRNAYAAVDYGENVPAGDKVYGVVPVGTCTNVSYLVKAGVNDAVSVPNVTAINATEAMQTAAALGLGSPFIDGENAAVKARPYNLVTRTAEEGPLEAPYPYPTLRLKLHEVWGNVPHYGDWLEATPPTPMSLVAYYEQFPGSDGYSTTTEYFCYVNSEEKSNFTARTGAIPNEGYVFLSQDKISTRWTDKGPRIEAYITLTGAESVKDYLMNMTELGALTEDLVPTYDAEQTAYYAYVMPWDVLEQVRPSSADLFTKMEITPVLDVSGDGTVTKGDTTTAWVNPLFGKAAYNGRDPGKPEKLAIRSLRHLNNITRFYQVPQYVQELDIDGSVYRGNMAFNAAGNTTMDGMELRVSYDGGATWVSYNRTDWLPPDRRVLFTPIAETDANNVLGAFNSVYDGTGRTIKNLIIGSRLVKDNAGSSKEFDYAGLFSRSLSGTVRNVHIENCHVTGVTGKDSNGSGVLMGRLSGVVENCTVKNSTVTAQGTEGGGHVGGLVGYVNDSGTLTDCYVESTSVNGGQFSYNVGGVAGYIYKQTATTTIRDCTAKNVQVSNQFSQESASSVEKRGSIGGFVGCMKSNEGTVDRCLVIGTGKTSFSGASTYCGGFVGVVSNAAAKGAVQNCGVHLEGKAKSGYAAQNVSGGKVSGGFVGTLLGGSVTQSYAAVKVDGATAGGFVGTLDGGALSNCYAGGHTQSGKYSAGRPNVSGTDFVGGFIGLWKKGGLTGPCYTTCAVSGTKELSTDVFANQETAVMNSSIDGCYALGTAFVNGGKRGSLTTTKVPVTMPELAKDKRTATFPYDTALTEGYPFQPVQGTDGSPMAHYGDWPEEIKTGSGGRDWVQQVEEYTPIDESYKNLEVDQPDWNGDTLTITYHVDSLNYENDLTNTGPLSPEGRPYFNGVFCLTSDLGYRQIFRFVNGADGYQVLGLPGATFTRTEVGTPGKEGHGFDWVIKIPSELIPPYVEYVSLDAMEHIDGEGDKCIIPNIINSDPNYSGANKVKRLPDDEGVTIGEEGVADPADTFKDWLGYRHQLMEIMAPLADTPLDGHMEGAALGLENMVYFHMINTNKDTIQDGITNITNNMMIWNIKELVLEGDNGLTVTIPGHDLVSGKQSYPSPLPGIVKYQVAGYFAPTWQGVDCVDIAFYASNDRQEYEMGVNLGMIAEALGYEDGSVFNEATLRFNNGTMRDLQVKRDPDKNDS